LALNCSRQNRIRRKKSFTLYHLCADGAKLRAKTAGVHQQLEPGSNIYVRLPPEKLKIFPK
jgi:hypothetical protein